MSDQSTGSDLSAEGGHGAVPLQGVPDRRGRPGS